MNKSVAIVAGVIVVGGGLWLGGAWYTGSRLEAKSAEQIAQINAALNATERDDVFEVSQLSFERGLFSSHGRYAVTIAPQSSKPATIEITADYEHGPFPLSALSKGKLAPAMALVHTEVARTPEVELWFVSAKDQKPFQMDTIVSYGGDAEFDGKFAPVVLKAGENGSPTNLDFSGATLQGTFARDTRHLVASFDAPTLSSKSAGDGPESLDVNGTKINVDVMQGKFGVQTGKAEIAINKLVVGGLSKRDRDIKHVSVDNFVYGGSTSEDDKFVSGEAYVRGNALTLDGLVFGDPSLTIKVGRIDGPALQRIMTAIDNAQKQQSGSSAAPAEDPKDVLIDNGTALLAANPTLAIDPLVWKNEKGESKLSITAAFTQPGNLGMPIPMILAQAVKTVNLDLNLNKPMAVQAGSLAMQRDRGMDAESATAAVSQQLDQQTAQLIELGFAKAEGDNIISQIQYDGKTFVINGREMPISELMGLFMAM